MYISSIAIIADKRLVSRNYIAKLYRNIEAISNDYVLRLLILYHTRTISNSYICCPLAATFLKILALLVTLLTLN